jgi:hypothetical protein
MKPRNRRFLKLGRRTLHFRKGWLRLPSFFKGSLFRYG